MSLIRPPASDSAPLLWADWPAPASVRAVTTLRRGGGFGRSLPPFDAFNLGDRCGDDPAAVAANRQSLQDLLALPSTPRWLRQVHGRDVYLAEQASIDAPRADAAVTREAGAVLAILSADCLPVLFCAADGGEIAAAHAGWRGLAGGVLEATLAAMRTPPARLHAWLGPAAGAGAYEVGADVRNAFVGDNPDAAEAFAPTRPGHWLCDLPRLARRRLHAAGLASVYGGQFCTIRDPRRFFSHRRDGTGGRMATLIWIAPGDGATRTGPDALPRLRV